MVLEMNNVLVKAMVWLTDLSVRTKAEQNRLAVNRSDLLNNTGCTETEILAELKNVPGSGRIFWTDITDEWITLESI